MSDFPSETAMTATACVVTTLDDLHPYCCAGPDGIAEADADGPAPPCIHCAAVETVTHDPDQCALCLNEEPS